MASDPVYFQMARLQGPNLALLGVSHHVRKEGLAVYLGKNRVVITANAFNNDPQDFAFRIYFLTKERTPYIRHLQVGFSRFELAGRYREDCNEDATSGLEGQGEDRDLTDAERQSMYHWHRQRGLHKIWAEKIQTLNNPYLWLKELTVDFTDCYCPDRCCRDVDYAAALAEQLLLGLDLSLERVDIMGTKSSKERIEIRDWWRYAVCAATLTVAYVRSCAEA